MKVQNRAAWRLKLNPAMHKEFVCLLHQPPRVQIRPIGQVLESAVVETAVPLDTQFSSNTL